jgi:hypothetical protein
VPVVIKEGVGVDVEESVIPSFHYSFQCSFSLISSYAYVFILRYVLSGLIEPLLRLCIYHYASQQQKVLSKWWSLCLCFMPPFWRTLVHFNVTINDPEDFRQHMQQLQVYVESGMFQQRLLAFLVTDISMLICFGVLFPPLAIIIALSVVKDVVSNRLTLSRFVYITESLQDERLKLQMLQLKTVIDQEVVKAGQTLWSGVWHGIVMSTWIWAFVLFDTLASTVGVIQGLWVLIVMLVAPFICNVAFAAIGPMKNSADKSIEENIVREGSATLPRSGRSSVISVYHNPMVQIEMRVSEAVSSEPS